MFSFARHPKLHVVVNSAVASCKADASSSGVNIDVLTCVDKLVQSTSQLSTSAAAAIFYLTVGLADWPCNTDRV